MYHFLSFIFIFVDLIGCLAAILDRTLLLIPAFLAGIASSIIVSPWNRSNLKGVLPPGARINSETGGAREVKSGQSLREVSKEVSVEPPWEVLHKVSRRLNHKYFYRKKRGNDLFKTILTTSVSFSFLGLIIGVPGAWLWKISLGDTVLAALGVGGSLLAHELAHYLFLVGHCDLSFHHAKLKVGVFQLIYGFFIIRNNRCSPSRNAFSALAGPLTNFGIALSCAGLKGPYFTVFAINAVLCCIELLPAGLIAPEVVPTDGEVFAYYLRDILLRRRSRNCRMFS